MPKYLDNFGIQQLIIKILELLDTKIDKENGKGLSQENFTSELRNKLTTLENYSLPIASDQTLGGIKIGFGLTIDENGIVSISSGGISSDIEEMTEEDINTLFE